MDAGLAFNHDATKVVDLDYEGLGLGITLSPCVGSFKLPWEWHKIIHTMAVYQRFHVSTWSTNVFCRAWMEASLDEVPRESSVDVTENDGATEHHFTDRTKFRSYVPKQKSSITHHDDKQRTRHHAGSLRLPNALSERTWNVDFP
jgi:hypothetical protein